MGVFVLAIKETILFLHKAQVDLIVDNIYRLFY